MHINSQQSHDCNKLRTFIAMVMIEVGHGVIESHLQPLSDEAFFTYSTANIEDGACLDTIAQGL